MRKSEGHVLCGPNLLLKHLLQGHLPNFGLQQQAVHQPEVLFRTLGDYAHLGDA